MEIHQLIFGYNNGHSLLNSSVDLTTEDKSLLLELTDWSGVNEYNMPTYITGFPLLKSNFYAVIRTWYADEMPRPGCVWSHVLLIKKEYFTDITNIESLFLLFLRPSEIDKNISIYNKPISIENSTTININKEKLLRAYSRNDLFVKELITKLYSTNDPIYLAPSSNPEILELLFLILWWNHPINDRFEFSFCTGSSAPRKYYNKDFRLQVITKEGFKGYLRSNSIDGEKEYFELWVNSIFQELISDGTNYIKYLNTISDDISPNQHKTIALAIIFELIKNEGSKYDSKFIVTELLDSLSKFFPERTEARKLKRGLLNQNVLLSLKEELFFLQKIVNIENYDSFDVEDLQIINRVIEIYHSNRTAFFELLNEIIKNNVNEFGISIFQKSSSLLNKEDIVVLINNYWSLYTIYISIQPSIISFNESWQITDYQCLEVINLLLSQSNKDIKWQFILSKVLDKRLQLLPKMIIALQLVEPNYISYVLDWYDSRPSQNINHQWISELTTNPGKVLDWIESKDHVNFSTMLLIVRIINPNSNNVIKRGTTMWMQFSDFAANNNSKDATYLHAFLISLAFNFNDSNAIKLLKNSFRIIYNEIANNSLDYNLTSMVLVHTKPLLFWQEWDKCKKLRIALADKFIEAKWDYSFISEIVKDFFLAEEIKSLCKKRK